MKPLPSQKTAGSHIKQKSCTGGAGPILSCKLLAALMAFVFLPTTLSAQDAAARIEPDPPQSIGPVKPYEPLRGHEKAAFYFNSIIGPFALAGAAGSAGVKQAWNSVPEWGQGLRGYGRRFASQYGKTAIRYSVQHGLGALLKEDPRYFRSGLAGFWPRSRHALAHIFRAREDSGEWKLSESRVAGVLAASLISRAWHPERDRSIVNGLESAVYLIGTDAAFNFLREFWPDIRKKLKR